MRKILDDFALWVGIISGVLSLITLFNEKVNRWVFYTLVTLSLVFFVAYFILHHFEKKPFPSQIDGIHINALDLMDTTFISNKHLSLDSAEISLRIEGKNTFYTYKYSGKIINCKTDYSQGLFFNVSSEANDIENRNEYYCYDLVADPYRKHRIAPDSTMPFGMSKRLFFPFQKTLKRNEKFIIEVHGEVYNPLPLRGTTYHFVRFSFGKRTLITQNVDYSFRISFDNNPKWINASNINKRKQLIKRGSLNFCIVSPQRFIL